METVIDYLHERTAGLHFEGKRNTGGQIVIDAAEIVPGKFEIMTMKPSGEEIECKIAYSPEEAAAVYHDMYKRYVEALPEVKPLTGKYAKLRDDLKAALVAGMAAEANEGNDGGTCNFDSPAIALPRWNSELVQRAAKEAGSSCYKWDSFGEKFWVVVPRTGAQGFARTANAEAMTKALQMAGYRATTYYQMD